MKLLPITAGSSLRSSRLVGQAQNPRTETRTGIQPAQTFTACMQQELDNVELPAVAANCGINGRNRTGWINCALGLPNANPLDQFLVESAFDDCNSRFPPAALPAF